ncbi:MAG: hypothetical protein ACK4ND_11675 [Cytophagaceae bacterium]
MNRFWLLFLFFVLGSAGLLHAQSNYNSFKSNGIGKYGLVADYTNYKNFYDTYSVGLAAEFSGRYVGLAYRAMIGYDSFRQRHISTGVGQFASYHLFQESGTLIGIVGLIGLIIPETFNAFVYPTYFSRLGVYVRPWGVEWRDTLFPETKMSIEAGVQYAVKVSNFYIEPFVGYKHIYRTERNGISAGLNVYFFNPS